MEKVAADLVEMLDRRTFDPSMFVYALTAQHPLIQPELFRLIKEILLVWGNGIPRNTEEEKRQTLSLKLLEVIAEFES